MKVVVERVVKLVYERGSNASRKASNPSSRASNASSKASGYARRVIVKLVVQHKSMPGGLVVTLVVQLATMPGDFWASGIDLCCTTTSLVVQLATMPGDFASLRAMPADSRFTTSCTLVNPKP